MASESTIPTGSNRLSPDSIAALHEPTRCERRVWLREASAVPEGEPSAFNRFLSEQGVIHEHRVSQEFRESGRALLELGRLAEDERIAATIEAVSDGCTDVICQGQLVGEVEIDGRMHRLVGRPDFLFLEEDRWAVADAKLSRSLFEKSGAEKGDKRSTFLQLRFYGWLFERAFPGVDFELRVHDGRGETQTIDYRGGGEVLDEIKRFLRIASLEAEPYEQVGHSKCGACGFKDHCWPRAEQSGDIGLLPAVTATNGPKLRAAGIDSVRAIADDGGATAGVSAKMVEEAEALLTGQPVRRRGPDGLPVEIDPDVSSDRNYVMFDLEGLPPELGQGERVYLWGMQVFGEDPGPFIAPLAGFDEDGDREGWELFLSEARKILDSHPGIRFVHWHFYERTMINRYIERYGDDSNGTAATVAGLLLDLLPIARKVVAIPAPGYSLKLVEKLDAVRELTGFTRGDGAVGKGDDSIIAYTRAATTDDPSERESLMASLCEYNREDLEATWAVQQWLASLDATQRPSTGSDSLSSHPAEVG